MNQSANLYALLQKIRALSEKRSFSNEKQQYKLDIEIAKLNYVLAAKKVTLKEVLKTTNNFPDEHSQELLTTDLLKDYVIAYHASNFTIHNFTVIFELEENGELKVQMERVSNLTYSERLKFLNCVWDEEIEVKYYL